MTAPQNTNTDPNNGGNEPGNGEGTQSTPPQNTDDKSTWTVDQWKAEAERWKGHSRTWENRATASEKEVKDLKEKHSSEEEKAIEKAKEEARAEERAKWAGTTVESAFRAANNGRFTNTQLEALLPGLNRSAFLSANGNDVDTEKVESYISAFAPAANNGSQNTETPPANPQHGAGGAGNNGNNSGGNKKGSLDEGAELYKNRANKGRAF